MDTALNGVEWLTEGAAMGRLGVSRWAVKKLARDGLIATMDMPGLERGRRYKGEDVDAITMAREAHREELFDQDEGINLNGHVPDWVHHRFLDRADACWVFLMAHGYLDRDVSETVRERIKEDIKRAGREHRFHCCDARSDVELWGEGWKKHYKGERGRSQTRRDDQGEDT